MSSPTVQEGATPVLEFIDTISQDADGVISASKKAVDLSNYVTKTDYVSATKFKGTLGTGGTISELSTLTSIDNGDMYKVTTAGEYTYKTNKKVNVKVGDVIIWNNSATEWIVIPSGDEPSGTVTQISAGTGLSTANNSEVAGDPITSTGTLYIRNKGITATQIADATITADQIYQNTITENEIALNAIDLLNLKDNQHSTAGNRNADTIVQAAANGQINSEKYAITSGTTVKATMQYDTTAKAVKFVFAS